MSIKKLFCKISEPYQEKIKKLLIISAVFLAGAVASTEINAIFPNGQINFDVLEEYVIKMSKDPFVILITGGGITSFLIPKLTNKIQDRKENFEIKKILMENINTSTTRLLEKTKMLSVGSVDSKALKDEFFEWRGSCAVIGTTVRAYWSAGKEKNEVVKEWNEYYKNVEELYNVIINFKKQEEHNDIKKNIILFLKKNDANFDLEYEDNEVEDITNAFFIQVKRQGASKTNSEKTSTASFEKTSTASFEKTKNPNSSETYSEEYSRALYELVRLFDKRKYYLLKLVFKNKIKNH